MKDKNEIYSSEPHYRILDGGAIAVVSISDANDDIPVMHAQLRIEFGAQLAPIGGAVILFYDPEDDMPMPLQYNQLIKVLSAEKYINSVVESFTELMKDTGDIYRRVCQNGEIALFGNQLMKLEYVGNDGK
ncbi:hypothetical protein [Morganella phage Mecenats66]|nr:hypothetical protein [Morganella phage Mecenats66]